MVAGRHGVGACVTVDGTPAVHGWQRPVVRWEAVAAAAAVLALEQSVPEHAPHSSGKQFGAGPTARSGATPCRGPGACTGGAARVHTRRRAPHSREQSDVQCTTGDLPLEAVEGFAARRQRGRGEGPERLRALLEGAAGERSREWGDGKEGRGPERGVERKPEEKGQKGGPVPGRVYTCSCAARMMDRGTEEQQQHRASAQQRGCSARHVDDGNGQHSTLASSFVVRRRFNLRW